MATAAFPRFGQGPHPATPAAIPMVTCSGVLLDAGLPLPQTSAVVFCYGFKGKRGMVLSTCREEGGQPWACSGRKPHTARFRR